jgi:phosphoenolpyruvate carboxykinase (ATP)
VLDENGRPDYTDNKFTENTRAVYPIEYIPGHDDDGRAGHANTIVFLTADAFGVLPPVSILSKEAAMYHFLSGFTSKLAGTEVGLGSEPEATFSTCFGAPFLPLPAVVYGKMLKERIEKHNARVFLVNTGWTGGPYGVGQRISLPATRRIVRAAISGELDNAETWRHPIFNLDVPKSVSGVPDEILDPGATWENREAYETQARDLAERFHKNFDRFSAIVTPEVKAAGPAPL